MLAIHDFQFLHHVNLAQTESLEELNQQKERKANKE